MFDEIRPGDLITSAFMKKVLEKLEELESRIAKLEDSGTGEVFIREIVPSGTLRIGQPIRVEGRNFQFTAGGHQVFFDGVRVVTFAAGSADNVLIFNIPPLPGVPPEGRDVVLTVTNATTTATRTLRILPMDTTLGGNVDVTFLDVTPDPFAPGDTPRFRFLIRSRATQSASFTLTPAITGPAWSRLLRVENEAGDIVPSVQLLPDSRATVYAALGPLPAGSNGTNFQLTLTAASGAVSGSDSDNFTVGQDVVEEDPSVALSISDFAPQGGSQGSLEGNTIHLISGFGRLTLAATFSRRDTYTFSAKTVSPTSGWNVLIPDNRDTYRVTDPPQDETPQVDIQVTPRASATGQLLLTLSGANPGDFGPKTLLVNLSKTRRIP